ncbi:hypothetical protein B0H99_103104 [Planomicrobium soli]|uniref:Uncharacterized protein n=1 Tax=Planomicrobium soli TaxID=1176648 RepID=A0A2P8H427_9BACL|nr:hypothetical protein [Planomicrobium soli]PSL40972.1 hypothetical protein B0H99_103104 [Planomicrobium soli]
MSSESIKALLETICQYNTARITQTFSKDDMDVIHVRCLPGTSTLELTFIENEQIEHYDSINEATKVIEKAINSHVNV